MRRLGVLIAALLAALAAGVPSQAGRGSLRIARGLTFRFRWKR